MTEVAITAPTPANVAETAEQEAALPLHELALIGIFTKSDGDTALLRQSDGTILTVRQGDTAGRMTVTALGDGKVHLADGAGRSQVLEMPA